MAKRSGLSESTIGRIWKDFEIKPHLVDGFKISSDPFFVDKVIDVVGIYHNPPEKLGRVSALTRNPRSKLSTGPTRSCR